jgi:hypothetical protein
VVKTGVSGETRVSRKTAATGKSSAGNRHVASGKMTASGKVPAGVAYRSVAAAEMTASRHMSTAAVAAAPAAGMALRQCRPSACQDQPQRANRQKNAFAPDTHDVTPSSAANGLFHKTYSMRP